MLYQRRTGGWPKNVDMVTPLSAEQRKQLIIDKEKVDDSTIDNRATVDPLRELAKIYNQTGQERFKVSFIKGIEFLLSGQYANGGWPQVWPVSIGYQYDITYNDDAMVNVLYLMRDIVNRERYFNESLVSESLRQRCDEAFRKGIDCILKTQIQVNGMPTIWCQQHDPVTLQPAFARSYELPSFGPRESARIVQLLMELPDPNDSVRRAIRGAMRWLDKHKIEGYRYVRASKDGKRHAHLVQDTTAEPIWARCYDLQTEEPFFSDRDGVPRMHLEDIGMERRDGYMWYHTTPNKLFKLYEHWKEKHDNSIVAR